MEEQITREAAEALWADLHSALVRTELILRKIVEKKAWLPLGYATFTEAWNDKMRGIRLATTAAKAVVAYALLDEGHSPDKVAELTDGAIGNVVAQRIAEQHRLGRPVTLVSTVPKRTIRATDEKHHPVQPHIRVNPSPSSTLHIVLGPERIREINRFFEEHESLDRDVEMARAIDNHMSRLILEAE